MMLLFYKYRQRMSERERIWDKEGFGKCKKDCRHLISPLLWLDRNHPAKCIDGNGFVINLWTRVDSDGNWTAWKREGCLNNANPAD